jgi:hypothetical protein
MTPTTNATTQQQTQRQSTKMALVPGLPVEIFKGKNIGRTGIFHRYTGRFNGSCYVTLDGNNQEQMFRTRSIRAIIVVVPPVVQPVPRGVGAVTGANPEGPADQEGPRGHAMLDMALNEIETLKTAILRLEQQLQTMRVN